MYMPPDTKLRLDPQDEYTHTPEAVSHYNESMYFNAFDTAKGVGAWMRIGNRPNEGHAEMTCCVYLPDGRVGFMYYPKLIKAWVKTAQREYTMTGTVGALVPLRHKRKGSDDPAPYTRITEGLTEYTCEGRTALGMSEYLDEMVGGVPISVKEAQI